MNAFEKLSRESVFYSNVMEDIKNDPVSGDDSVSETENLGVTKPSELQFYVDRVGFTLGHTIFWCNQLDLSVKLLSNFTYSKKFSYSRADHLVLNVENYLIRLQSVYDRVLQLLNVTFHLCIDDGHVNHRVIVSNHKVKHRPQVLMAIKQIRKSLDEYAQVRHTLIHKHSYLEKRLSNIELFYMDIPSISEDLEYYEHLKRYREHYLRDYLKDKKKEFSEINSKIAKLMFDLFSLLSEEYERQKIILK